MKKYKSKLSRTLILGQTGFILVACVILVTFGYRIMIKSVYSQYEAYISDLLRYAKSEIDVDDLENCLRTGIESEEYVKLQVLLNQIKENYAIDNIYIIKECARDADMAILYGGTDGKRTECTGIFPLVNSRGEVVAILAADMALDGMKDLLHSYILVTVAIIVGFVILFAGGTLLWLQRRVLGPVKRLELAVNEFIEKCKTQQDSNTLLFGYPHIQSGDEMESLSNTVYRMSKIVRDYCKSLAVAKKEVLTVQEHATQMDEIAYIDALTGVKNKAAYEKEKSRLEWDIINRTAKFALVMVDVNYLKRVNDNYGHEKGDIYLKNSCQLLRGIYMRSPIFRIGGDEFLVILMNEDYDARNELKERLSEAFHSKSADGSLEPWLRVSAAIGVAAYDPSIDSSVDEVFAKADKAMYENKAEMKAGLH